MELFLIRDQSSPVDWPPAALRQNRSNDLLKPVEIYQKISDHNFAAQVLLVGIGARGSAGRKTEKIVQLLLGTTQLFTQIEPP